MVGAAPVVVLVIVIVGSGSSGRCRSVVSGCGQGVVMALTFVARPALNDCYCQNRFPSTER